MRNGFTPAPIVTQELRTNSQGLTPSWQRRKSSLFLRGIITAGQSIVLPVAGDRFFYDVGTGPLKIRPDTQHENEYFPGMGLKYNSEQEAFSQLWVSNPNAFSVFYIIFAGFDDLDDRRTFYPSIQFKQIVNSVYDFVNDAVDLSIDVPDLSGSTITYDGQEYYVINRQLLYVFNSHNSNGAFVQNSAGRNLASVQPNSAIQIPLTGDLVVDHSLAACSPVVSELYNCLPVPA